MSKDISPSDLKSILHSKRANLYYLERCRVLVNGGRVEYVTENNLQSLYWNIPIANTTAILLGTGTSITQAAMRELSKAGVLVGFCGGGGTPLFTGIEAMEEAVWLSPQSEYRPTQYMQQWVRFWFDASLRLKAAKMFQTIRLGRVLPSWQKLKKAGFEDTWSLDLNVLTELLEEFKTSIEHASDQSALLTLEARLSKVLYKLAAEASSYGEFARNKRGQSTDPANRFLDHGNYLAYGLGATATWVLGLPHGLAVLHGKTRRGGLVFDVADLIKDANVLPLAFIAAARGYSEQEFRAACIEGFASTESLDFMIDTLKDIASQLDQLCGEKL